MPYKQKYVEGILGINRIYNIFLLLTFLCNIPPQFSRSTTPLWVRVHILMGMTWFDSKDAGVVLLDEEEGLLEDGLHGHHLLLLHLIHPNLLKS